MTRQAGKAALIPFYLSFLPSLKGARSEKIKRAREPLRSEKVGERDKKKRARSEWRESERFPSFALLILSLSLFPLSFVSRVASYAFSLSLLWLYRHFSNAYQRQLTTSPSIPKEIARKKRVIRRRKTSMKGKCRRKREREWMSEAFLRHRASSLSLTLSLSFSYTFSSSFSLRSLGSVCKVRTQDPENFDEEVKSLLTAWRIK